MKYLSLFSGIGGFELGIQQAYEELCNANRSEDRGGEENTQGDEGQRFQSKEGEEISTKKRPASKCNNNIINERPLCVGYSEIDKYAIQVYNKQFNHKNYGDITKINAKRLPDFEMLVGGFPCQSFSIAGKRGGFQDTRGTLFFEIARIAREKQPRLLLLENVKGLLSHDKGRTFYTTISTLDELGYDCQWQVLNSKNFGVPQNRERVFIVGHLRGTSRPEVFPIGQSYSKNNGNGKGENSGTIIALYGKQPTDGTYIKQLNQPKHSNDRLYSEEGISPTLNTMQGGNRQPFIKGETKIRRLTPKECERLQGFPDDWTKEGYLSIKEKNKLKEDEIDWDELYRSEGYRVKTSDTQRYKMCGNAVTVNVIKEIMLKLI